MPHGFFGEAATLIR